MYQQILFPTDGSKGTAHVALEAIGIAQEHDSAIHVLYVVENQGRTTAADITGEPGDSEHGQQAVERIGALARAHDIDVVTEIRSGTPADTILAYADEVDANLIVAGTHGRSGVERYVLGSVAEHVVRRSEIPVMTVRLPDTDVTVADSAQATTLARETLRDRGYQTVSATAERQHHVWVVEVTADEDELLIYIDPITQRVSVVNR